MEGSPLNVELDPTLFWPTTVIDLIFQHLTANEAVGATLVSPEWNDFVGKSQVCMQKLSLTIIGRKYFLSGRAEEFRNELAMLCGSERRYQNLTLYAQRPGFLAQELIDVLRSRQGKWKSVKIWSEKFQDESQLRIMLESLVDSVEELDLRNISVVQLTQDCQTLNFKRLKILSLCNVSEWFMRNLQNCSLSLETLDVENVSADALIVFLENLKKLKTLKVTLSKWNDQLFAQLSTLKNLKLREFKIKLLSSSGPESQDGLKNFFEAQADLTRLTVDLALSKSALKSIFPLSRLETLHFATPQLACALPTNRSINELRLNFQGSSELITNLIAAAPNLKILKIPSIDESLEVIIEAVSSNLKIVLD